MQLQELLNKSAPEEKQASNDLSSYIAGIEVIKAINAEKEASIKGNIKNIKNKMVSDRTAEKAPESTPEAKVENTSLKDKASVSIKAVKDTVSGLSNKQKALAAAAIVSTPVIATLLHKHLKKKKEESLDKVASDFIDDVYNHFKEASFKEVSSAWEGSMLEILGK